MRGKTSDRPIPRYLRFTQTLALVSGITSATLWACGSSKAPPVAVTEPKPDGGDAADAASDAIGFGGFDVPQQEFDPPSDAPFDAPDLGDGKEVRTCRCPGEDANTPDLVEAGLTECASYAEAKYNNCFGIPGPLPPPDLPRRRRPARARRRRAARV